MALQFVYCSQVEYKQILFMRLHHDMYRYSMMTYRYVSVDACIDSVPIVTASI